MFVRKLILGVVFNTALFAAMLFLPAGRLDWWRGWVLVGFVFVATAAMMIGVFRDRPELLRERMKGMIQKGQPALDRVLVLAFLTTYIGSIVFIPLDVFQLRLLPRPAISISSLGLVLYVAGWWIVALSFMANPFAAPVVRHQKERNHTVVDSGAYSVVRHPMYAGLILLMIGLPLWLESYAAALAAIVPSGLITLRLLFEERFLLRELKGYGPYMEKVRYRLAPYVW